MFAIEPLNDQPPLPVFSGPTAADTLEQSARGNSSLARNANSNNNHNNAVFRVAVGGTRALAEELVRHADADSDQDDGKLLFCVNALPCGLLVRPGPGANTGTRASVEASAGESESQPEEQQSQWSETWQTVDRFLQMELAARQVLFVQRGPLSCRMRYTVNDSLHVTPGFAACAFQK